MKWTPAEAFYNFYYKIAVADFFRAMRYINDGNLEVAAHSLFLADMTLIPFSLEGLDETQQDAMLARLECL